MNVSALTRPAPFRLAAHARIVLCAGLMLLGAAAQADTTIAADALAPNALVQPCLAKASDARDSSDVDPMILMMPIVGILLGLAYWRTWQARKQQQELQIRLEQQDAELIRMEKRLENASHFDSLTGLPNRHLLRARLQQMLHGQAEPKHGLAMLRIRIGGLKRINETLGYAVGDGTLHAVGELLSGAARESDVACHLGANEFAMLVTSARDNRAIDAICARLIARLAEPMMVAGHAVQLDANVGIVPCDQVGTASPDELLSAADDALTMARDTGANTWRWGVAESFTFTA